MTEPRPLLTPILLKQDPDFEGPEDENAYYVMARNGLFMCRNHEFYKSCVPASSWPKELADQRTYLYPSYPKISRGKFELVVGFFTRIAELHGSEAGVILIWDRDEGRVKLHVPEQKATVGAGAGSDVYPIGLHFDHPTDLPPNQFVFGDIHSHVDGPAYASGVDVHDEIHKPGLHIVVGKISQDPPDIHIEAVVDGTRFTMKQEWVIGGFQKRRDNVPQEWIDKVEVPPPNWGWPSAGSNGSSWANDSYGDGYASGSSGYTSSSGYSDTPGSWSSSRDANPSSRDANPGDEPEEADDAGTEKRGSGKKRKGERHESE